MKKSTSMVYKSEFVCYEGAARWTECIPNYREQLIHQLKLNEKEHDEKLQREKAKRMAKVQVRTYPLCIVCWLFISCVHRQRNLCRKRKCLTWWS